MNHVKYRKLSSIISLSLVTSQFHLICIFFNASISTINLRIDCALNIISICFTLFCIISCMINYFLILDCQNCLNYVHFVAFKLLFSYFYLAIFKFCFIYFSKNPLQYSFLTKSKYTVLTPSNI